MEQRPPRTMFIPQTEIIVLVKGTERLRRTVPPGDYTIGCGQDADLVLDCEGVSTLHAELTVNADELFIEDLGSRNGVFVNGRAVTECVRLWPNQKVQVGEAVLEMRRIRPQTDEDLSLVPQVATVRQALPEEFLRERKYEIGGLIGEGGMGAILNAHEATTGRTVAMKVVLSNSQPSALLRFIKEAQITSQLEHPNIVPLHELGIDEHEQVFYTMKLVRGITLKEILGMVASGTPEERSRYPLTRILTIFQKVCDAIGFAHSRGVIHRDLKPDNVIVGEYGEVLVLDWGLAKVLGEEPAPLENDFADVEDWSLRGSATMAGVVLGTPHYMPPEQARGDIDSHGPRSDIYSLGAILYQILTLRPPVSGADAHEVVENVRCGRIEPLRASRANPPWPIPESLAAVALKALALDPADRYTCVQELQADVVAYQRGFATAAEGAGLGKQLKLLIARHKREAAIFGATISTLLVIVVSAFVHVTHERSVATRARRSAEAERVDAQTARAHAVAERARSETERNRANAALAELRKAAPAFQEEAGTLVEEQKFEDALEKNAMAIQLVPDRADYHLFRGHTLAAMQRLPEAVESYRKVIALRAGDTEARSNLELCDRLVAESAGKPLTPEQQTQLLDAILVQRRPAHAVLLAKLLGRQSDERLALIETRLKSLLQQKTWSDARLLKQPDGTFALNLEGLIVPDLSLLRGLPVSVLKLGPGGINDLRPLADLPLKELDCSGNPVSDLSPLRKLPLERLNISQTKVNDLAPLLGMPLRKLATGFTSVADLRPLQRMALQTLSLAGLGIASIEPLRGLRLRELDLFACRSLTGVAPLASLTELQSVNLPAQINDLAFVTQLRSLQRMGNSGAVIDGTAFEKLPTVAEFIATQGQRLAREKQFGPRLDTLRNLLRKYGLPEAKIADVVLDNQGFLNLDLAGIALADLSSLYGLPIRNLIIRRTGASDLAGLRGMPLVSLDAGENPISSIVALASCNDLKVLDLQGTEVADLRPLQRLKIERLILARTKVQDLAALQGLPLVELDLLECPNLKNLAPLLACTRLQTVLIPRIGPDARILLKSRSVLRLTDRPFASFGNDWTKVPKVKEFQFPVRNLDGLRAELRRLGMAEQQVAAIDFAEDGLLELDLRTLPIEDLSFLKSLPIRSLTLDNCNVSDISPLAGAPLRTLTLMRTKVSDLTPLRGAPLEYLELHNTPVSDLSHLGECKSLRELRISGTQVGDLAQILRFPLTTLHIKDTKVSDLSRLVECPTLQAIEVSENARGLEALRQLPQLQRISSRYDNEKHQVAQTAAEFWVEFDARSKAGAKREDEFKIAPAEVTANQIGALTKRAETHLRFGRFKEAAADMNRLSELDPTSMRFVAAGPMLVQAGDVETYRRLCRRGLEIFSGSSDMEARERIAKICVLIQDESDAAASLSLAESALEMGTANKGFLPWAYLTKGMAEYRAGRFSPSAESVEKAFGYNNAPSVVRATAQAVLAMAYQRSQRPNEARAALARATELMGDTFAQPPGVAPVMVLASWHDWLIGRLMLREAQAVVSGKPVESSTP